MARLLAFAHQLEADIRAGFYLDLADAARQLGLTRARITQIANLTLLAPSIQSTLLAECCAGGRNHVSERSLRSIVAEAAWVRQVPPWHNLAVQGQRRVH